MAIQISFKLRGILTIFCFLFFCFGFSSNAQQVFDPPKDIPPFKIMLTSGNPYEKSQLSYERPLLIIYFSPDCEHCQALTKELESKMSSFSKTNILMISFVDLNSIKNFEIQYKLNVYPNIKIGTEGTIFTVRNYLHLQRTPFVGLYDRKGKLVKGYDNNPPFDELISLVNKTASSGSRKK